MSFTERLKEARISVGYTQQQVADAMGITNSTYCGYETGKRQPDVAKIKQLAKILKTSGDFLPVLSLWAARKIREIFPAAMKTTLRIYLRISNF